MASDATATLREILDFFESKRRVAVAEVGEVFREAQDTQLTETMYNQEEVSSLVQSLEDSVTLRMEEALKRTEHMNALLLRMAIADASDRGVALSVDPRRAEDATLLAEMEQLRLGKLELSQRASRAVKLESLGTDAKRLEGEVESLREENETLRRRYQQMQRQVTDLCADLAQLRAHGGEGKAGEGPDAAEVAELRARLEEAEEEAKRTVMQSRQFQQMKRILEKKNQQLQVLRETLAKYEPDATPAE